MCDEVCEVAVGMDQVVGAKVGENVGKMGLEVGMGEKAGAQGECGPTQEGSQRQRCMRGTCIEHE